MNSAWIRTIFFSFLMVFLIFTVFICSSVTEGASTAHADPRVDNGKLLFQKYNCIACHQVYGLGGYMGPDLTNVISAKGKGEAYAKAFLKSGSKRMPDFSLSDSEVGDLLMYLKYLDGTGISPVKEYTINLSGTVNYKGK